jgi:hypothetical protein
MLTAAGFAAAVFMLADAAPAFAEYGAFARDEATGKYGFSWNEANQKQAEDAAIKSCNTTGCKTAFKFGPKKCGAITLTDDGRSGAAHGTDKSRHELTRSGLPEAHQGSVRGEGSSATSESLPRTAVIAAERSSAGGLSRWGLLRC